MPFWKTLERFLCLLGEFYVNTICKEICTWFLSFFYQRNRNWVKSIFHAELFFCAKCFPTFWLQETENLLYKDVTVPSYFWRWNIINCDRTSRPLSESNKKVHSWLRPAASGFWLLPYQRQFCKEIFIVAKLPYARWNCRSHKAISRGIRQFRFYKNFLTKLPLIRQ